MLNLNDSLPYQKLDFEFGPAEIIELEVIPAHLKLLQRIRIEYLNSGNYMLGEIALNSKRPYGNEMACFDVLKTFGIEYEDENIGPAIEFATKIHIQMASILQILAYNLSIEPGIYIRDKYRLNVWTKKIF